MPRRWVLFAFATVLFSVMPAVPASAAGPTHVTSHISTNTTWTRTGQPYIVDIPTLWIQPGVTLTIQPGVTVVMNQSLGVLGVQGNLQAIGTRRRPIVFTGGPDHFSGSTAKGQWRYIGFEGAGTGTLAFVEIRYGGYLPSDYAPYAYSALWMDSSVQVLVDHAWIHDNNNSGILATSYAPIYVSGTIIHNNDIGVSAVGTSGGAFVIEHSSLSYNGVYGLFTNHSTAPLVQSVVTYSDIIGNGRTGVRLQEDASTPANKYPTGNHNNITNNAGDGIDELTVLQARAHPDEALWEPNYWGPDIGITLPCPFAITLWPYHLVAPDPTNSFPPKGPIESTVWELKDPDTGETLATCRTDRMKVGTVSQTPIPNLVPDSPPW
jgi:hypothetical protein